MFDRDVVGGKLEHQRKIGTQEIDALAMGPDLYFLAVPLRHGAGRRDRAVRDIRPGILPLERASFRRRRGGFLAGDDGSFRRLALRPRRKVVFIGQRFTRGPCGALAQRGEGCFRARLGLANHARKIAVTHDRNQAFHLTRAILVQFNQSCMQEVRAQHAAMQLAGQSQVMNEARAAENLVRNIEPLHGMAGNRALLR